MIKNNGFTDKVIKCKDCSQFFAWTVDQQKYYQQKGLKPPLRCPMCRARYQAAKADKFRGDVNTRS